MGRAVRQRVVLAAAVAGLLGLAAWQLVHDRAAAPGTLLDVPPAAVTRVALAIDGAPPAHYEKRDGHWWRVDGAPARADDGRLAELAATAAAPVEAWRPARAYDPAKIGLSPPQAMLQLDGQTLEFGEVAVTGALRYVRVGPRVALVPARYSPRPPTGTVRDAGQ